MSRALICTAVLLLAVAAPCALAAAPPQPLGDLATAPVDPTLGTPVTPPEGFAEIGGRLLFSSAYDSQDAGCVLWSFDGSPAGVRRLTLSSHPEPGEQCFRPLGNLDGVAILRATDGRLWRSDGTRAGTRLLTDAPLFVAASEIAASGAAGRPFLLFYGCGDREGAEPCGLWRTDGTREGTRRLPSFSEPNFRFDHQLLAWQGKVYFTASLDQAYGVWRSDGTEQGTVLLAPAAGSGDGPSTLAATPSALFFSSDGATGEELWVSDGTIAGTRRLRQFAPVVCRFHECYSYLAHLWPLGEAVVFLARDGAHGGEVWRSDGTEDGTLRVSDLPDDASPYEVRPFQANGRWIFGAYRGESQQPTLWTALGSPETTAPLTLCPGADCPEVRSLFPGEHQTLGRLLFSAWDEEHGEELWSTDGTSSGTQRLADICPETCGSLEGVYRPSLAAFPETSSAVFFQANAFDTPNPYSHPFELWATDGTPDGTQRISTSPVRELGKLAGRLYFGTADALHASVGIDATDGTTAGTVEVTRAGPLGTFESRSSNPRFWPARRGALILTFDGEREQVWRTDGSPAGTQPIPALTSDLDAYQFDAPAARVGPWIYFSRLHFHSADHDRFETELWRSDGTVAGTTLFARIGESVSIDAGVRTSWNGRSLFLVSGQGGLSFWTTDGTSSGTRELFALPPGVRAPTVVHPFGDRFLYVARVEHRSGPIPQLFVSDGTLAGTRALTAIAETREPLEPAPMATVGGAVFFLLSGPDFGPTELWVTNGTAAGTRPAFRDLRRPADLLALRGALYFTAQAGNDESGARGLFRWSPGGSQPLLLAIVDRSSDGGYAPLLTGFTPLGARLFFSGLDARGEELWVTDGTVPGTHIVRDIRPGPESSSLALLTAAGDRLYFSASDSTHGQELWVSDGTAAGTQLVADLWPGFLSGVRPGGDGSMVLANGKLLFAADDGVHGIEPWALRVEP